MRTKADSLRDWDTRIEEYLKYEKNARLVLHASMGVLVASLLLVALQVTAGIAGWWTWRPGTIGAHFIFAGGAFIVGLLHRDLVKRWRGRLTAARELRAAIEAEPETRLPPLARSEWFTGALGRAFATLQLPIGTPLADIKERYRMLMRQHHPDLGGSHEKAATITAAYSFLRRTLTPPTAIELGPHCNVSLGGTRDG